MHSFHSRHRRGVVPAGKGINMENAQLTAILKKHKLWRGGVTGGERADLQGADLWGAVLRGADLQRAVLRGANLQRAVLRGTDLRGADLQGANLQGADLQGANLQGADLQRADLDFSCFPLWCGSMGMKVDIKFIYQLLAHICALDCPEADEIKKSIMPYAVKSHRASDLGLKGN